MYLLLPISSSNSTFIYADYGNDRINDKRYKVNKQLHIEDRNATTDRTSTLDKDPMYK